VKQKKQVRMPSIRAFACGAVLLLACTAIVAHAADTPAANATPAAATAPANATAAAAAAPVAAAAAAAPASNKPVAAAAAAPVAAPATNKPVPAAAAAATPVAAAAAANKPVVAAGAANKPVAAAAAVAADGDGYTKPKYEKYEEGSGSTKGAKPKYKYVDPDPGTTCIIPGADCSALAPACDRYAVQCAPGTECVSICNNCQATCLAVLTCTGGESEERERESESEREKSRERAGYREIDTYRERERHGT
jgi:hypothetical protein